MLNTNDIKAIVFDFDETLYYSPNALTYYIKFIKQTILDLSNYTEQQALNIMDEYGFTKKGENRVSFGKNCHKFGIPTEKWNNYKLTHFFEVDYANCTIVNNSLLKQLSKKVKLFIITNEYIENVKYKADKLGIDLSVFTKIYSPNKLTNLSVSKTDYYKSINTEFNINFNQMFAIGDRYQVDIKPLIELGGCGKQIENTQQIEDIIKNNFL